jgi:hypothetical protein
MLQAGPPHAEEAVVFVHGNPGTSRDWTRLVERTGAFARAVAWDHPRFGQADKPAGFDYTVPGYAAHLGRCLEAFGITRAHLVLHDFSGPWGKLDPYVPIAFAERHREVFPDAQVVIMEGAATGPSPTIRMGWHGWSLPPLGHGSRGSWRALVVSPHEVVLGQAPAPSCVGLICRLSPAAPQPNTSLPCSGRMKP